MLSSLKKEIEKYKPKTYWKRGVKQYSIELLENLTDDHLCNILLLKKGLLNGADSWHTYSYGGCSLIYNKDIAQRLCTPSEYKKKKEGELNPNRYENWLDVQTRALKQAERLIALTYYTLQKEY